MAIKNDIPGVEQYLHKRDHTLVMYITIHRRKPQRDIKEWLDIHKETSEVVEYI